MPLLPILNLDKETVDKHKQNDARVNTLKFWEEASQIQEKLQSFSIAFSNSSESVREDRENR